MSKKTLKFGLLAPLVVVALVAGACGQELEATTKIPFSFTANGRVLPAGDYTVRALGDRRIVVIESVNDPGNFVTMVLNGHDTPDSSNVTLRFANDGGQRTLIGIQTPAGSIALK